MLWARVVKDVTPSKKQRKAAAGISTVSVHTTQGDVVEHRLPITHTNNISARPKSRASMQQTPANPLYSGDPKMDRRAGRERLAIDATLDLHGHTQISAERELTRFIKEAHARRSRCVLVITGKGAAGTGVLRQRFVDWIAASSIRPLIARAAQAHARHGGSGAYYVFIKAQKKG